MSKLQRLRALLKQRLDAEDEIFELFERTIADFEEELTRLKEKERRYKLLDAVFSPEVHLHSLVFPAEVQQLVVVKEEDPPQWSPNLEQQHPEPLHIKEEQHEVWSSQEGEQLHRLEEPDITRFPSTAVPVKSEDEEKPQCSQLHQSQTEDNREAEPPVSSSATQMETGSGGEDCGGSEAARNQDPDGHSLLSTDEKASETEVQIEDGQESLADSGPESEDSDGGWMEARQSESGGNSREGSQTVHTEEKQFDCDVCGKRFKFEINLKRHMRIHKKEKWFDCNFCGKRLKHKHSLKKHMTLHQEDKLFGDSEGEDCGGSQPPRNQDPEMNSHSSQTEDSEDEWQEPLSDCGAETKDRDTAWKETVAPESDIDAQVDSQMGIHAAQKQFDCDVCGMRFTQEKNLSRHTRLHARENPYCCRVCMKRFTRNTHLKNHMTVHTGEELFSCDACGKAFNCKRDFERHVAFHTGEKPFGCGVCGRRFHLKTYLNAHFRVHNKQESTVECDICGKAFLVKRDLERHTRTHTGEKQFGCDVCGKKFRQQIHLTTHARTHTGEKPFSCDICGRKFNRSTHVRSHMQVHSKERQKFPCGVCGKTFKRKGSFAVHAKVHTE